MGDKNIQIATIPDTIEEQLQNQPLCAPSHLGLRVLVRCTGVITNRTFHAGDQQVQGGTWAQRLSTFSHPPGSHNVVPL